MKRLGEARFSFRRLLVEKREVAFYLSGFVEDCWEAPYLEISLL